MHVCVRKCSMFAKALELTPKNVYVNEHIFRSLSFLKSLKDILDKCLITALGDSGENSRLSHMQRFEKTPLASNYEY